MFGAHRARFGHLGEQGEGGGGGKAREADKDVGSGLKAVVTGGQDAGPFLVDGFDLRVDLVQVLLALALEQGQCQGLAAVQRGGPMLHQGAPRGEPFGQAINDFVFCGRIAGCIVAP